MNYKLKYDLQAININEILKAKGVDNPDRYIYISKAEELNPKLLDNMEVGAKALIDAIENNKKFALLVDSDNDGFTSAAIIFNYLLKIKDDIDITPFFHTEKQHGLMDMEEILLGDYEFIIIPDAASNDYEFHKEFKERNKEILILDHHLADKYSEDAIVINNQLSDNYENKSLSGAGVTFKFCQYLDELLKVDYANEYYDLAAVGIIGDLMDLRHYENRYICDRGLKTINNPFIAALVEKQSYSIGGTLTPTAVSFYLSPLINALIRVGTQEEKTLMFYAMTSKGNELVKSTKRGAKPDDVETLAGQMARVCSNARAKQTRILDKAVDYFEMQIQKEELYDNKIIVVEVKNDLENTLTGLVAMRLSATYKKPVLLLRRDTNDVLKGSARGPSNTEMGGLKEFLEESEMFEYCAGHSFAFGLGLPAKNLDSFINYSNEKLEKVDFNEGVYEVDFEITEHNLSTLSPIILELGKYNALWGQGIEEPQFIVSDLDVKSIDITLMGNDKRTLKIYKNGISFIKFKADKLIEKIKDLDSFKITILGRANINNWGGRLSPQVFIEDFEILNDTKDIDEIDFEELFRF